MKKKWMLLPLLAMLALTAACDQGLKARIKQLEEKVAKLEKRVPGRKQPKEQKAAYQLPVGASYLLGEKSAPVTVTIFSDVECPFCARTDPLMHKIIKDEKLKGKVNVAFKHFPLSFHKNAKPGSKAAMAAGEQGAEYFWKMLEKCYANQRALSDKNYKVWAKEIGLNVAKFEADLKKHNDKYEKIIKQDMELGIKKANVRGTPSIYVGGWELRERSVEGVRKLIKEKKLL